MVFIIGGAHQGKLDYAKAAFSIEDNDVFACDGAEIDFSRRCIYRIEEFALACVRENIDPTEYFRSRRERWNDSILICRDIFCGVVPLGAEMRAWRQATGRLCRYLSGEAAQVSRLFCGLEQRLK